MRTTLTIDDEIFDAASQISRTSGQRLGQVISDLARRGLNPAPAVQIVQSGRFPVFGIPADTPLLDADAVQRAIDEEGF